ncbi:hypothetical protein CI109_100970 [Kwoniella shandongensis]|uniref:Uncharacterized protein n=1 Tax=Kwoniella shandongensis TaxID=1734106 RepID=A0A5M6C9G0_9TREE|nr:uncharacterized protein CI109_001438 [Kwoniella shandongensis]KAA5530035.1 hypothetical protein CI109_001438 [Kwoniella shandongensis]
MASNILPLFWPLANSSKETRLNASASLISSLENFQQSYHPGKPKAGSSTGDQVEEEDDESEDEDDDEDDDDESGMEVDASDDEDGDEDGERDLEGARLDKQLSKDNADDIVYCVKRLVRGLASSRESSRLGFAVALTELLSRIPTVTARQIFSLVIRNSQYNKSMKGSDERDLMFARLFGITAIVQSKSLYASTSTKDDFRNVVEGLIWLGQGKAWMRESAWWTLVEAVQGLVSSEVEWKDAAFEELVEIIFEEKTWTQEKVALVLLLEDQLPQLDWKSHLAPTFKYTPLLNSHNLVTLGRVLKEASGEEDEGIAASTSGSWKPQLHFVWSIILDRYFPKATSSSSENTSEAPFQDFFRVVVDESLFSNTASSQRRYWGFQVFERALPLLPPSQMPLIFTPNFMRCWMNNLSSADRYLHKAALQIAKRVQDVIKENPKVGFTLLSQLVGKHGRQDFDKVTKTKTVESIMGSLNVDGVKEFVTYLQSIISGNAQENLDSSRIDERRLWALDQIQALCRNGSVPKDDNWVSSVLDFLLVHGFFLIRKTDKKSAIAALHAAPKPALSESTAAACRARFFSCLVELTTASVSQRATDESSKPTRQQGCDLSGKLWVRRAVETISALENDTKHVELVTDADEEIKVIRKGASATLTGLSKAKEDDKEVAKGVEILLSFFVLQTYDEVDDALDLLEDVNTAAQKIFDLPSTESSASSDDDEAAPIDALLDVLIALLDKGSSDLRNLANLVFGTVSSAFTESSMKLLNAQLEQSAASAAAEDGDDDDDEVEDEVDQEEGSDDDDEEEAESSEEEEDDDDDDNLAPVDPAFRQRVAEALQVAGMGVDENADDGSDDEQEEYWDDDQMMKVDEQLAEVFRQQATTTKRTDLKHLQIESLHFKNRILDFYDTYAKRQLTNPVVLEVVGALLRLVRASASSEGELANKAAGILRSRFNKPKDVPSSADVDVAAELLTQIHEMAQKAPSAEFSNLCSVCSLFVSRAIDASTDSSDKSSATESSPVVESYRKTLADFMTRKSSLVHPAFVLDFVKRFPLRAFGLHDDLTNYVQPGVGVNAYRQTQAYTMLQTLSQHLPVISKSGSVSSDEISTFVGKAAEQVYATLESAASTSTSTSTTKEGEKSTGAGAWNASRLKDVVKFALQLARSSKSIGVKWDLERVKVVGDTFANGEKTKEMKGVRSMWSQLESILGGGGNAKKDKKDKKGKGKVVAEEQGEEKMEVDGEKADVPSKSEKKVKKVKKTSTSETTNASTEKPAKKRKTEDGEIKSKKQKSKSAAPSTSS